MSRRILIGVLCLAIAWATSINPAAGQSASKPADANFSSGPTEKERAIQYRLAQPISLDFKDVPLRDVIRAISIQSGIQVVPDTRALAEAKISLEFPITGGVDHIAMKNALNVLFKPVRLEWIIEDEVLKITAEDRAGGMYRHKEYKVGDIVDLLPTAEGQPRRVGGDGLVDLLKSTVAKQSWEDMGGRGTIQYFPAEKKLAITQIQEVHEEVQLYLATVRKLVIRPIAVDVRFLRCSNAKELLANMAEVGVVAEAYPKCAAPLAGPAAMEAFPPCNLNLPMPCKYQEPTKPLAPSKQIVTMSDHCVEDFLEKARAAGGNVDPAPLIRVFEFHSHCSKNSTEQVEVRPGKAHSNQRWRCAVEAAESFESLGMRLNLAVEHIALDGATERITRATGTFIVERERTLIWHFGRAANGEYLFALVTPRVIVAEEERDETPLANVPPIPGR